MAYKPTSATDRTVDVYVKIPTGRTAVYYVQPEDYILKVCRKVAEEEKVKENQVRLKYQGKILRSGNSVNYYGVRPETILKAEILVPRSVTLTVTLPNELGTTEVTSSSLDTVSDVIAKICDTIKENNSHVIMKYDGRTVKGETLLDAGLVDGSAVEIQISKPEENPFKATGGAKAAAAAADDLKDEDKQAIVNSFDTGGRPVDVVFSFDTTGSMYNCLDQVRSKLKDSCTRLIQDIPNIRIGVIAHGDYCDEGSPYVIRTLDLTSDVQSLLDFVTNVPKTSGGDSPECYEWVLRKAQELDWSEQSAKALVVIGDAIPHPPGYTDAQVFWKDELTLLTGMGIKVYGVRALKQTHSMPFYQELADVSGGHYLTMTHFDVITDMFLAVCYRESNEEDLGQFEREVEEAGRMTEERREIFKSLQKQKTPQPSDTATATDTQSAAADRPQRDIRSDWWMPELYTGDPQFHYDPQTDKWSPCTPPSRQVTLSPSGGSRPESTPSRNSLLRRKKGGKCSIM